MSSPNFVILGAGISGLALAWFLKKRHHSATITILEKDRRPGGWIRTETSQGFLVEKGPRSCRSRGNGIETLRLIEELGLEEEWIGASPESILRYLYTDNRLQCLPTNLTSFFTSPLMKGVFSALIREWQKPASNKEDESIYDFISRRFNPHIAQLFIDPLTSGIYAGNIQELSMQSCFPEMFHREKKYGSLSKAWLFEKLKYRSTTTTSSFVENAKKSPIFSLRSGMETLVKSLSHHLSEHLQLESWAVSLQKSARGIEVHTSYNQIIEADQVFIALPFHATEHLISPFVDTISPIASCSVSVVNLAWNHNVLNRSGFGYLVPSQEQQDVLGVVWDSSVFPQQNQSPNETRLTVMLGGAHRPDIPLMPESAVNQLALNAIEKHLGIHALPDMIHTSVASHAIPQYAVGHQERIKGLEFALSESTASRIQLLGASWKGVSVNDCIANAKKMAFTSF